MCTTCENESFPELEAGEIKRLKDVVAKFITNEVIPSINEKEICPNSRKWEAVEYIVKDVLEYVCR